VVKHMVMGWSTKKIISGGSVQVGLDVCKALLRCYMCDGFKLWYRLWQFREL